MDDIEDTNEQPEVLITLEPSVPRRVTGAGAFIALGGLMVWLGISTSPPFWSAVFLALGGVLSMYLGMRFWLGTDTALELTQTELRETNGEVLVRIDEVASVERGAFAFKPSNGFTIRTKLRDGYRFRPGIWWRVGRSIGVGGLMGAGQSKAAAEIMTVLVKGHELES